jgi:hypothetical protein
VNLDEESKEVSPGGEEKPLSEEQHNEESVEDEESRRPRRKGFFRKTIGFIGSILSYIWRGVVWLFQTETNPRAG